MSSHVEKLSISMLTVRVDPSSHMIVYASTERARCASSTSPNVGCPVTRTSSKGRTIFTFFLIFSGCGKSLSFFRSIPLSGSGLDARVVPGLGITVPHIGFIGMHKPDRFEKAEALG